MKRFLITSISLLLIFGLSNVANSTSITFDEVPVFTLDPTIKDVSFWAGDPLNWNDTYTDDLNNPGNAYLHCGIDDGTGNSPGLYETFIGISSLADPFAEITFELACLSTWKSSTTFWADAYNSSDLGTKVSSVSITIPDTDHAYHQLSMASSIGFDTIFIYDEDTDFATANYFCIDSVDFTPIPEPSSIFLLLCGLFGSVFLIKRRGRIQLKSK